MAADKLLINSMQQCYSWKANNSSSGQEVPSTLWNQKVHYLVHNSPPPLPILSQNNSIHAHTILYLKDTFYYNPPTFQSSRIHKFSCRIIQHFRCYSGKRTTNKSVYTTLCRV